MPIVIQIDDSAFKKFEGILATMKDGAGTVMARTINRVLPSARAQATREVRKELPLPIRQINKTYGLKTAYKNDLTGWISSRGRPIPLIYFNARPKKPGTRPPVGASAVPKRSAGREVFPGSFVAQMRSGHVGMFERTGRSRFPIRELMGPSIPDVLNRDPAKGHIEKYTNERLEREFAHQVSYLINQVDG